MRTDFRCLIGAHFLNAASELAGELGDSGADEKRDFASPAILSVEPYLDF